MPEIFSPALANRIATSRLRSSMNEAMMRGDFYAARQLQKRQEAWRAAEVVIVKPAEETRPPVVTKPVHVDGATSDDDDGFYHHPPPLEEWPDKKTAGWRALDDFIAIVASEYRRSRDAETLKDQYREEWIRAGCPGSLHDFAKWKTSGQDHEYTFDEWLELKEQERSEELLRRGGIHGPSPLFEQLYQLRRVIVEHGLVAECHTRLQEMRREDRQAREAVAHERLLRERTADAHDIWSPYVARAVAAAVRHNRLRERDRGNDRGGFER